MSCFIVTTVAVLVHAWSGVLCAPLHPSGDFDSQLQHILHKQMMSAQDPADIISRVLGDVRTTLSKRWQDFTLTPFGSLTTGLGAINSDVDISLQLGNFNTSAPADSYVLHEAKQLFLDQPALYSYVNGIVRPRYARCSFLHIPTHREVDLVFRNGEGGVYESKVVKYYFGLDEKYLHLASFLKYWFEIQGLTCHVADALQNYGLYLIIIFYLQQKNLVPPAYVLQIDSKSHFVEYWDMGFKELPNNLTNTENLHQLLGGFFKYYSEFNFEEYIVAPFPGRPIPRSAFKDIDNFPIEYTLYNNTLKRTVQHMITNDLNCTDVCIQDVFEHNSNAGLRLSHEYVTKFKYLMKTVAAMFEDLPSDSILRAILVTDPHKEIVINHKNATVAGINEQDIT